MILQPSFVSEALAPRTISALVRRDTTKRRLPVARLLELNRSVVDPGCSVMVMAVETEMTQRVFLVGFFSKTWIDVSLTPRREV